MTTANPFVHLHLHTEYSLLDGGNKISRLLDRVKELGMDAVAVTDHGNLHGAVEFYSKATDAGVKPILGIEAYVAPGDRTERRTTGVADGGFHLVLLAENETGWRNLLKLSSDSFLNGFYYKPRMDKSTLRQHREGLIAINGHLGSSIAHHLVQFVQTGNDSHWDSALAEAAWHAECFSANAQGDPCFFVELQMHDVTEQRRINPHLIRLARELDLPLVGDNDAHYLRREDWDDHDTLCCISMGKLKDETNRINYSKELYVKSPEEMSELFHDLPEAVENSVKIAQRCNVELDFDANHAPVVRVVSAFEELPSDAARTVELLRTFDCPHPLGSTEWFKAVCEQIRLEPYDREQDSESADELKERCDGALRMLAEAGAIWRYGADGVDADKRARLERELKILADKLISAYFLIVWDFVDWARQRGIPAAARGSGVGTMVGYVLGLSNACPDRYGLLFERFTDPDRAEYPDIDIDICQDGRADVLDYVRQKYGHVAQIITFGRLKARQALKDVARVHGLPPSEGQRLANLIPDELNITLDEALQKEPDLRSEHEGNPIIRRVVETARALEDHARHSGVHAAGVVIATQPLDNIVPLCRAAGSEEVVTQWDGPTCERVGLLKMDFLGLRTLSTIERARTLIAETLPDDEAWRAVGREPNDGGAHPLDLERLRYDDQRVLELFRRADTAGIFQFESGGMRKLLQQMQPDRLEDLIAANALFRPGPMDLIPEYCLRKHGKQPVPQVHEIVDAHTAETYGIMVYQEQVMQIVHGLGDIPLRRAYSLIKAISKKKHSVIDAERPKFIEGAQEKGLSTKNADELFDLILKFAGYGFNKSHSTGYAIIAYHTAYLKTYFPNQYMAAVLTYESNARKVEDWVQYLEHCRETHFPDHTAELPHIGVDVKPPDLNRSEAAFSVVFEEGEPKDVLHGHVRFGLGAIRGLGRATVDRIIEERRAHGPYASIFDLCERVADRSINRAAVESLVKCGAMDSIHGSDARAAVTSAIDEAIAAGQTLAEDRAAGQLNMFQAMEAESPEEERGDRPLPVATPWDRSTMLANEKETLGFHISGHPLDAFDEVVRTYGTATTSDMDRRPQDATIALAGVLSRVRITVAKTGRNAGQKMAMITVQDKRGSVEGVVFSNVFARCAASLQTDAIVMLIARVDRTRGEPQLIVDDVVDMDRVPCFLAGGIEIDLHASDGAPVEPAMEMLAGVLQQSMAAGSGDSGRPVDVVIHLHTSGRRVTLRPRRIQLVPEPLLISRIGELVGGHQHVRIVPGAPPVTAPPRRHRQAARAG